MDPDRDAMNTEQTEPVAPGPSPSAPPEWGAPPSASAQKPKWTTKRTVITVVVAVAVAAAGGVAIYAASGTVNNGNGQPPNGARMVVGGPMMSDTQHGEFQIGDVTAITDDDITVKSKDGYEKTYALTADTQKTDDIAKGDEVNVTATTENGKTTAKSVMELGDMAGGRGPGGPRQGGGPAKPDN